MAQLNSDVCNILGLEGEQGQNTEDAYSINMNLNTSMNFNTSTRFQSVNSKTNCKRKDEYKRNKSRRISNKK